MNVLAIRKHSRFAVCNRARISNASQDLADALLVELSLDGCRLGNVADGALNPGETVAIEIDGAPPFSGQVRWTIDGSTGLKLTKPFHTYELDRLIHLCRDGKPARKAIGAS